MKFTPEQRLSWAEKTASSPFNRWLADQTRGPDGRLDLEKLYALALDHGIDKRTEYQTLNPGQQRMNLGNALRSRVPRSVYEEYATPTSLSTPQVFGTWFWGFDPTQTPFASFTYEGSRNSLIQRARPGDLIAVVGTKTQWTAPGDRGMLLGLIEFQHTAMQAEDLTPEGVELPARLFEDGRFRWPYAVPAVRAWRFDPPHPVTSVIGRQLTSAAITGVDQLTEQEVKAVLALPVIEVDLPPSRVQVRDQRLTHAAQIKLDPASSGQPGPPPSEWSSLISHLDGPTATYLMRFGEENVWKIGISQNPAKRRDCLNFSVPSEILDGRCWKIALQHRWENGMAAYEMEQTILKELSAHATANERVKAPETIVHRAWQNYLLGRS